MWVRQDQGVCDKDCDGYWPRTSFRSITEVVKQIGLCEVLSRQACGTHKQGLCMWHCHLQGRGLEKDKYLGLAPWGARSCKGITDPGSLHKVG